MSAATPWDICDDAPAEDLLAAAGWSAAAVERCRTLFTSLGRDERAAGAGPSRESVTSLLVHLGLGDDAQHCCRAIFRRSPLSFEDLVVGMAALDPNTTHGGVWNGLRAQYIFRCYDRDGDGALSLPELSVLLAHVRRAYGNPPLASAEEDAEARRAWGLLLGGGAHAGGVLTFAVFREGVGALRLRGCSRLFRLSSPLFPPTTGAPPPPPTATSPPGAPPGAPLQAWASPLEAAPSAAAPSAADWWVIAEPPAASNGGAGPLLCSSSSCARLPTATKTTTQPPPQQPSQSTLPHQVPHLQQWAPPSPSREASPVRTTASERDGHRACGPAAPSPAAAAASTMATPACAPLPSRAPSGRMRTAEAAAAKLAAAVAAEGSATGGSGGSGGGGSSGGGSCGGGGCSSGGGGVPAAARLREQAVEDAPGSGGGVAAHAHSPGGSREVPG